MAVQFRLALRAAAIAAIAAIAAGTAHAQVTRVAPAYPDTRKSDQTDMYHGQTIADPYRWLESNESPEVASWVAAQNRVTQSYLSSLGSRAAVRERLGQYWNYAKTSVPVRVKSRYFYSLNTGVQNQSVLHVHEGRNGKPRVLLDPNTLSSDGTVAVGMISPSPDSDLLAYSVSTAGSDWQEIRVRDVRTGADMADTLRWAKFSDADWTRDSKGFFYTRYDEPVAGRELSNVVTNQKLYFHVIGTPQSEDILILSRRDQPDLVYDVEVSTDGEYAVIMAHKGTDTRNLVYFIDLALGGVKRVNSPVVRLIDRFVGSFQFLHSDLNPAQTRFYFLTDFDAPNGRIIYIDIDRPEMEYWTTVVPTGPHVIRDARFVYDRFVVHQLQDAYSQLRFYTLRGTPTGGVAVGALGTVGEITGDERHEDMFFSFSSYLSPPMVYHYDMERSRLDTTFQTKVEFPFEQYETRQIYARGKDGVRIPIFVTARKGIPLDGSHPTMLFGYGGFNIPVTPEFSPTTLTWLSMGGIYAVANIRGGGEFGIDWYRSGTLLSKQNVFDDFIASAEHLISTGYTSPAKLAIQGGSNGGLLVGAVMTQRPELAAVALPAVGVLDMLRFHKFTIGWAWTSDYGSSDNPEQFKALLAYSPLHNVKAGTRYPATLITTGDHDDRVVPAHSYKFAAALQAAQAGPAPVLIRIDTRAGHGAGKPTSMRIEEAADRLAFAWENLGMPVLQGLRGM